MTTPTHTQPLLVLPPGMDGTARPGYSSVLTPPCVRNPRPLLQAAPAAAADAVAAFLTGLSAAQESD